MKSFRNAFNNPFSSSFSTSPPAFTSNEPSNRASLLAPGPSVATPVTVFELFQSQGCNSCPTANSFCIGISDQNDPNQLLLTYEVTYWDHLGWPDTFGDMRWDARQRAYATALRQRSCYTPQVIVDGGAKPIGNSWRNLPVILAAAKDEGYPLQFELPQSGNLLCISGSEGRAFIVAVFYEVEPAPVRILRGENRGETLPHRNVVRDVKLLGTWQGGSTSVELPAKRNNLETAVLVQAGNGGPIIGAVRV